MPNRYLQAFCYDYLRDWKRETHQRQGMLLTTVHRAKGLEFNTVCIPDGDWRIDNEETRRLFYVGMTRAKQNLLLIQGRIKARLACAACAERSRSKRSRSIAPYPPILCQPVLVDTLRLIRPCILTSMMISYHHTEIRETVSALRP